MILPILVPPVAIGSMWKLMYNYDFGVFNQTLVALSVSPVNWLGSTSVALAAVIVVDIWHWVPFVFLICSPRSRAFRPTSSKRRASTVRPAARSCGG